MVIRPARARARLLLEEAAEAVGLSLVVEDEVRPHARPQARVQPADLALDPLLPRDVAAAPAEAALAAAAAALAPPPPAVDVLPLYDCSPARRFIASPHFAICKAILNELIYGRTQLRFSDTVVFYQSEKRGL